MLSNRLAVGALVIACIAAAAGGGYVATRQNAVPTPAAAMTPATTTAVDPATPAQIESVQETEALVGGAGPTSAAPPAAAPPAASPAAAPPRERPAEVTRAAPPARPARRAAPPSPPVARQEPPALERSWPSSAAPGAQPEPAPSPDPVAHALPAPVEERPAEPARAPEPPPPAFEELVVEADSVIGLQMDTAVSTEKARVEDRVEAHVTREVRVDDRTAIPAGARAIGSVTVAERGGKFKERARLGIRFHTLVLDDGTELAISTETVYREGDPPNSAQKVGGAAVGGAILGAIIGGSKGAVLGGLAGAGGGAAVTMAGDRNAASLAAGAPVTVRILAPITVNVEKEN
jgi:hypothetical protein